MPKQEMVLISVLDKKSGAFGPPQTYDHVTQALRSYVLFARQKPDAMQVQFCEDYDLYDVGSFNTETGMVTTHIPQFLERLANLVSEANKGQANG